MDSAFSEGAASVVILLRLKISLPYDSSTKPRAHIVYNLIHLVFINIVYLTHARDKTANKINGN